MSELLVEMRDVVVRRNRKTVLAIDHFALPKGDILAVVGPNGAGKSTFLHLLSRLIRPSQGDVWFNGRSIRQESDLVYRRRLGLVLQAPLLFDMTVFENVALGLRFRRMPQKVREQQIQGHILKNGHIK